MTCKNKMIKGMIQCFECGVIVDKEKSHSGYCSRCYEHHKYMERRRCFNGIKDMRQKKEANNEVV